MAMGRGDPPGKGLWQVSLLWKQLRGGQWCWLMGTFWPCIDILNPTAGLRGRCHCLILWIRRPDHSHEEEAGVGCLASACGDQEDAPPSALGGSWASG